MIGLAVQMMRIRAAHAVTILILAAVSVGTAVATPLYVRHAQDSVTAADVSATPAAQTIIASTYGVLVKPRPGNETDARRAQANRSAEFDQKATQALRIPGFNQVFSVGLDANVLTEPFAPFDPDFPSNLPQRWLEFRQDICQHVRLTSGRCPAAAGEIMVGPTLAKSLKLVTGSVIYLRAMTNLPASPRDPGSAIWAPAGEATTLSVVGEYAAADPTDVYFAGDVSIARGGTEPLYTARSTVTAVDHSNEEQRVLAYPGQAALSPAMVATMQPQVLRALTTMRAINSTQTSIMDVLTRVGRDREQVGVLPNLLELPLIILCCFVVFLAAANTATARRGEFGMLKLRGGTTADRLWLASAEIVTPLVAGGILGYLLGHLAVWLLAHATLSVPGGFSLTWAFLPQAAAALIAVIIAGLAGLRRDLATPVADLLRRIPGRGSRWGAAIGRVVVIVVAVAAIVQSRSTTGQLTGIGILAPAAVILALGLLTSMLFDPFAGWWGRRAIRTGRLGSAMAMLHWSRRRTGTRIVALLTVATALVGYVAIAYGIGTTARHNQVVADLGAHRVATVPAMSMRGLLEAVRRADPDGTYAMAVMPVGASNPSVLAVDSPRLSVVGPWPQQGKDGLDAKAAERVLRPNVGNSVIVRGTGVTLTAATRVDPIDHLLLGVVLAPLDGAPAQYVQLTQTAPGADTYHADVACPAGCRLSTVVIDNFTTVIYARDADGPPISITLSALRQTGPDAQLVGPADFNAWVDRQQAEFTLQPSAAGAVLTVSQIIRTTKLPVWIGPPDLPEQLPSLAPTGLTRPPTSVPLPIPVITAGARSVVAPIAGAIPTAHTAVLPRLGADGVLVDMEYLARLGEPGQTRTGGEVWLGPAAPPDALDRLRAAGLTVLSVRDFDEEYARACDLANAVGLQFLVVVSVVCLLIGAGGITIACTAELRARAEELSSLRHQGAASRIVARAAATSYLAVVVAGSGLGLLTAIVAWLLTRSRIPVMDPLVSGVSVPNWPGLTPLWAWLDATVVLVAVALGLAATLARRTRRGDSRRRPRGGSGGMLNAALNRTFAHRLTLAERRSR